jgi:DNA-binding MarR family transcriptional regulator
VATIGTLAERMALRHHSAVELINRLEKRGYVRRTRGRDDRRRVIVSLLPVGERKVEEVVRNRFDEMHSDVKQLVETLIGLLEQTQHERGGNRRTTRLRQRVQGQRG